MKRILIIEGGGADGLFAIGAVKYFIQDRGLEFDAMFGTSIGGAIILSLACDFTRSRSWIQACDQTIADFTGINKWDLLDRLTWGFFFGGYLKSNIKKLTNNLFARNMVMSDLAIHCEVFATDVDAIEPIKCISNGYRVDDACAITTNVPGVFSYFEDPFTKNRLFDGGVACNSPIAYAIKYAQHGSILSDDWKNVEFYLIRLGNYKSLDKKKVITATGLLIHCFSIARMECERLSIKLSVALESETRNKGYKLNVLHMPYDLGLLEFNSQTNMSHVNKGYEYAKRYYANHPNW